MFLSVCNPNKHRTEAAVVSSISYVSGLKYKYNYRIIVQFFKPSSDLIFRVNFPRYHRKLAIRNYYVINILFAVEQNKVNRVRYATCDYMFLNRANVYKIIRVAPNNMRLGEPFIPSANHVDLISLA